MFLAVEYYEGKAAFREGWAEDENPYGLGTTEHSDWQDGYDDAEGESQM